MACEVQQEREKAKLSKQYAIRFHVGSGELNDLQPFEDKTQVGELFVWEERKGSWMAALHNQDAGRQQNCAHQKWQKSTHEHMKRVREAKHSGGSHHQRNGVKSKCSEVMTFGKLLVVIAQSFGVGNVQATRPAKVGMFFQSAEAARR